MKKIEITLKTVVFCCNSVVEHLIYYSHSQGNKTKQKQSSLDQNLNYRKEVSVMMKLNKLATMNHNNHNNTNHTNKGGRKMKGTKKIKTRIIAGMLSLVTVFSVGACSVTTASAAGAPSVASIAKDVSNFAIDKVIDKYVTNGIAGSLLKMGTGYLLNWIFDEKEEEKKTVDDAIKEIDKLRQTMEENHKEEMNSLKVINGSIDTQTFRKAADSLHDDYSTVLEKISNNARNITASGEGKINENTYKAYKAILADSTCNLQHLQSLEAGEELQSHARLRSRQAPEHQQTVRLRSNHQVPL